MTESITKEAKLARAEQNGVLGSIPSSYSGGPKPLMPGSWLSRGVRVEYRDDDGRAQSLSGKLLDLYPSGLAVGVNGCRMLLSWDALILCELVEG